MSTQIVPVGRGFLVLVTSKVSADAHDWIRSGWERRFPEVPMMLFDEARVIILGDGSTMFEFAGPISPEALDAFRAWWEAQTA